MGRCFQNQVQHPKGGLITILEDTLGWSAFDLPDTTVTTSDKDTKKYPVKTLRLKRTIGDFL